MLPLIHSEIEHNTILGQKLTISEGPAPDFSRRKWGSKILPRADALFFSLAAPGTYLLVPLSVSIN